jgi:hypothetical protein
LIAVCFENNLKDFLKHLTEKEVRGRETAEKFFVELMKKKKLEKLKGFASFSDSCEKRFVGGQRS